VVNIIPIRRLLVGKDATLSPRLVLLKGIAGVSPR